MDKTLSLNDVNSPTNRAPPPNGQQGGAFYPGQPAQQNQAPPFSNFQNPNLGPSHQGWGPPGGFVPNWYCPPWQGMYPTGPGNQMQQLPQYLQWNNQVPMATVSPTPAPIPPPTNEFAQGIIPQDRLDESERTIESTAEDKKSPTKSSAALTAKIFRWLENAPLKFYLMSAHPDILKIIGARGGVVVPNIDDAYVIIAPMIYVSSSVDEIYSKLPKGKAILKEDWVFECDQKSSLVDWDAYTISRVHTSTDTKVTFSKSPRREEALFQASSRREEVNTEVKNVEVDPVAVHDAEEEALIEILISKGHALTSDQVYRELRRQFPSTSAEILKHLVKEKPQRVKDAVNSRITTSKPMLTQSSSNPPLKIRQNLSSPSKDPKNLSTRQTASPSAKEGPEPRLRSDPVTYPSTSPSPPAAVVWTQGKNRFTPEELDWALKMYAHALKTKPQMKMLNLAKELVSKSTAHPLTSWNAYILKHRAAFEDIRARLIVDDNLDEPQPQKPLSTSVRGKGPARKATPEQVDEDEFPDFESDTNPSSDSDDAAAVKNVLGEPPLPRRSTLGGRIVSATEAARASTSSSTRSQHGITRKRFQDSEIEAMAAYLAMFGDATTTSIEFWIPFQKQNPERSAASWRAAHRNKADIINQRAARLRSKRVSKIRIPSSDDDGSGNEDEHNQDLRPSTTSKPIDPAVVRNNTAHLVLRGSRHHTGSSGGQENDSGTSGMGEVIKVERTSPPLKRWNRGALDVEDGTGPDPKRRRTSAVVDIIDLVSP